MKRKISFNETVEVIRTPPKKFKSNEQHPKVLKKDAQHKGGPKNSPKPKPMYDFLKKGKRGKSKQKNGKETRKGTKKDQKLKKNEKKTKK